MSDVYQIASIGLLAGKERLAAISENAASASLPGYRRHVPVGRAFDAMLTQPALRQVDLRPGAIAATGRALDLAVDGTDAFFALTDGNQTWLTRGGAFRLNDEGVLVGERGLRVVGAQGDVRLPGSNVTIEADGRITYQGVVVAALQLFRPNDRTSLQAAEGALLTAPSGVQPVEAQAARVRSGMLEASNTDATREMLGLMALSRQFESLTQILQSYDELLGRAIQKLGEV